MASERKGRIFSDTEEDSTLWRQQLSNLTEGIVFLNNEIFKARNCGGLIEKDEMRCPCFIKSYEHGTILK